MSPALMFTPNHTSIPARDFSASLIGIEAGDQTGFQMGALHGESNVNPHKVWYVQAGFHCSQLCSDIA